MSISDRAPFSDLQSLIQSVQWPVMPEAGQALIRTLNDDDADTFAVCRIIKKDPALTATLLRMANSALFGLSGSVDTLERAVSVVGISMVRTRALSLCMAHACRFPPGMDRMAFWQYSLLCAGYAQWLADLCEVDDQEAWLCGMMLRLGGLSVVQARPEHAHTLEATPSDSVTRWTLQRRLVGFDEGEITAELAQQWDFPLALVRGLRHCAQPLATDHLSRLAAAMHLAARLADSGAVTKQSIETLPLMLLNLLKLEPQALMGNPPDVAALEDMSLFNS
ncbi:HDOD domain-containing protein [Rhodoferax sp.]|uniref:HDOD domain-containing protein n=1 Tax=Rhodoferax sp. TaxID=50421 RepID=UPI00283DB829|nr:HDOD domain-containing protein [Rhodoferax sp.]MDR3370272.1 HDOD domain-containing protein [Rhodoferax sp.]